MTLFTPRIHQRIIADHIIHHKRCAIWVPMGFGKSAATLTALDELSLIEDVFPALIIAPLRVAQTTWPDEISKWSNFSHLKIFPIIGNAVERAEGMMRKADLFSVNPENIPWLITRLEGRWPYKTIVVDESRKLQGFRLRQGTARTRMLSKVAFRSERFIELTGTPCPRSLADLWGQLWFLDKGERLGRTYSAFMSRWFVKGWDGFSYEPLPHAQKEIEDLLKDICLSLPKSFFPTKEPIRIPVEVTLPPPAMRQYKAMERDMFVQIKKHGIEAFNAAVKTGKCLQLCGGAIYTDDKGKYEVVHDEKIKALESIISESSGAPVLVVYNFKSSLERLQKAFLHGVVLDKNPKTIKKWNAGKIPLMFIHPASAGHGLDLHHSCNILVFFEINWDLELHQQVIERIGPARQKQAGYDRPVFLYYILAKDTLDYVVRDRLDSKKTVQECLLEAMRKVL